MDYSRALSRYGGVPLGAGAATLALMETGKYFGIEIPASVHVLAPSVAYFIIALNSARADLINPLRKVFQRA
jgi:hypothetical protein